MKINFLEHSQSLSPSLHDGSPGVIGQHPQQAALPPHAIPSSAQSTAISGASNVMFQLGSPHHPVGEPLFMRSTPTTTSISPTVLTTPSTSRVQSGHQQQGFHEFSPREQPSSTSSFPELPSSTMTVKTERKGQYSLLYNCSTNLLIDTILYLYVLHLQAL